MRRVTFGLLLPSAALQVIAQGIDEDDLPTYDSKVDIWSMGVVLYEALSGLQPFLADSAADMLTVIGTRLAKRLAADQQQQQQHQRQHWSLQQQQDMPAFIARMCVSAECKDFLSACLAWDPTKRPSAADLLSHPWLTRMQEEAAAVAANRASSRRISMQVTMQRARLSAENSSRAVLSAAAAALAVQATDASDSKLLQPAGAQGEVPSLLDPVMAGMLHDPANLKYARQSSLDLTAYGLERSQTSEQLEIGAHNVLRTHTQRLEARPLKGRVHAA